MCRSPDFERYVEKESLKVKAFFVRFTGLPTRGFLPDSLTLLYPPRINEAAFELDGSKIRPDSPAFVTLHRVVKGGDVIYGSRERVRVWEGIRFEVYMSEERVIKGIFRKDEGDKWKLECECEMEEEGAAEVVVAAEGHVATATMARKHRRRRKQRIWVMCLGVGYLVSKASTKTLTSGRRRRTRRTFF